MAAPVAVAVVSWNTRELLARCLESLAGEADAGRAEVWVVDNASDDGSAELVAERFGWVRLERAGANLGFGAAVNRVAAGTDTPWLAMANADVRVRAGALERLLAAGAADSGAGALAPRLLLPDGSAQHSVFPFPSVPFALGLNLGALRLAPALADRLAMPGSWDSERARRVPWAIGAFLLVRRPAWDAAGGFDDSQWLYAEDLDLGWRLRRAGWATRYVPEAVVEHEAAAATDALVALRRGYRAATLTSLTPWRFPINYHWPTDVPDGLHWDTLERAVEVTLAFLRRRALSGVPAGDGRAPARSRA